ncbi:hypothetical protein HYPSUDRAFT_209193 [Hypholoma sublateritium FD-334 SS-4]|uniref:Uncharacterized protein n=1 Tax=Hypholoma sublateritium (strain FD-334 SS-4) TaxID=945553 RepID=A0A0D2KH02_HYPSF|nr:hypothetical protein HYPSUDRAFT_209193 [Hypholoma sublateritium FD-334 SS-4]
MARSKLAKRINNSKKAPAVSNKKYKLRCPPRMSYKEGGATSTTSGPSGPGNERTRIVTSTRSYFDKYGVLQKAVKLRRTITSKVTVLFDKRTQSASNSEFDGSTDFSSYESDADNSTDSDTSGRERTPCPPPRLPAPFPMQLDDSNSDSVGIVKKRVKLPGFRTIDEFFLPGASKNIKSTARTTIRRQIFVDSDIPLTPIASGSNAQPAAVVIDVDADDEA